MEYWQLRQLKRPKVGKPFFCPGSPDPPPVQLQDSVWEGGLACGESQEAKSQAQGKANLHPEAFPLRDLPLRLPTVKHQVFNIFRHRSHPHSPQKLVGSSSGNRQGPSAGHPALGLVQSQPLGAGVIRLEPQGEPGYPGSAPEQHDRPRPGAFFGSHRTPSLRYLRGPKWPCQRLKWLSAGEEPPRLHRLLSGQRFCRKPAVIPVLPPGKPIFSPWHHPLPCSLDCPGLPPHSHLERLFFSFPLAQQISFLCSGLLSCVYLRGPSCPVPVFQWLFQLLVWPSDTSVRTFQTLWDLSTNSIFQQTG
ncbi:protein FAM178B [Tachyglossus aculeatus]|uniref:protein FAM178B n=1 Tax=Tachyglossus aculeatus TaxID=9261 RepID=UPI0018F6F9BC|nr:protein FAM178B [Tachyglossus aculeatus]